MDGGRVFVFLVCCRRDDSATALPFQSSAPSLAGRHRTDRHRIVCRGFGAVALYRTRCPVGRFAHAGHRRYGRGGDLPARRLDGRPPDLSLAAGFSSGQDVSISQGIL